MGWVSGFLAGILGAASIGSSVPAVPQSTNGQVIKVLTLNFNSESHRSELKDLRFSAMIDWVHANDPDILLLQEVWDYKHDSSVGLTLARALGYDLAYRLDEGAPLLLYDSDVILAKKSLGLSREDDFKLPHSAFHIGDGKTWIVAFGRISYAVGARLRLANGDPLYVYSTHLIAESDSDRRDQLVALHQRIRKKIIHDGGDPEKAKVIVGGDLNSTPESLAIQFMRGQGYDDAWTAAHGNDPGYTMRANPGLPFFNPFSVATELFPAQQDLGEESRIDYLFTHGENQKTAAATEVFTVPYKKAWMSDHYGVFATVVFNGDAPANLPNPVLDSEESGPDAAIFPVTGDLFACDQNPIECENGPVTLPDQFVSSFRGLVIENQAQDEIQIRIDGPGLIFNESNGSLSPGGAGAFVFSQAGDYTYTIEDRARESIVQGTFHVLRGF